MFIWGGVLPFSGLERDKFDNKTVTFEEHIQVEHNMWHYLFFIVLVKVKDSTEFTGPESYVAEMIRVRMFLCMNSWPIICLSFSKHNIFVYVYITLLLAN